MRTAAAAGGTRFFEHHLRAIHAVAAVRRDARQILQQLEIGDTFTDDTMDVAVGHTVAEADDHGAAGGIQEDVASLTQMGILLITFLDPAQIGGAFMLPAPPAASASAH